MAIFSGVDGGGVLLCAIRQDRAHELQSGAPPTASYGCRLCDNLRTAWIVAMGVVVVIRW